MATDTDSPRQRLIRERDTLTERADDDFPSELADRLLTLSNALDDAYPGEKLIKQSGDIEEYAPGTVYQYIHVLKRWYDLTDIDYRSVTSNDINQLAAQMDTGRHSEAPDGGYSRQTVNKFLCAAKAFYDYHGDLGIQRDEIDMFKKTSESAYDARDMFSNEDIQALRDAMKDVRRRALLETFIYTGQRLRAILTLRIKDIDTDEGYFYLNEEVDGLKNATRRGRKRPLLGARKYLREWIEDYHPCSDDSEAFVFIGDPSNPQTKLDKPISERSVRRMLAQAKEDAGINTEVKPHKFRHYFVSVMSSDYELDDTIKFLMGHGKGSNVMNTTYKHVKSEDYIAKTEEALGYKRQETRNSFVPESCAVCGEALQPDWKQCPACGEVYAPDAEAAQQQFKEAMFDSAVEASTPENQDALKVLQRWFEENPDKAAEALTDAMTSTENRRIQ